MAGDQNQCTFFIIHFSERHFLVFWPEEECYSEVPESKVVGEPGVVGESIHVKEGAKVHQGVLIAEGSKQVVQQKLEEIESGDPSGGQGKLFYFIVMCTSI